MGKILMKKPGRMQRAVTAWFVLNLALGLVFGVSVWVMQPYMSNWYVALPMLLAFIISETSITTQTIQPILADWIDGSYWIDDPNDAKIASEPPPDRRILRS